jgi:GNAT superfamily N-acetyltransferase
MDEERLRAQAVTVRRSRVEDSAGIAHVHVRAWQEAYVETLPAERLDELDEESRALTWAQIIQDDSTDVFVAEREGRVVGWATTSVRHADAPADRELEGIYVLAQEYGKGTGQALLDAAISDQAAFLWMLDRNPRAEAFYTRNGFIRDGGRQKRAVLGVPVVTVRLSRDKRS